MEEAKKANATVDFTDMRGHWAKKTIDIYEDVTFRPNNPITRADFVAMLNCVFPIQGGRTGNYR